MIRITTRDIGLTQVATIWVGETKAIEFFTRTKHADRSIEIAEKVLADVLSVLIANDVDPYKGSE